MGDPGGIGPEITVKSSLHLVKSGSPIRPVIIGSQECVSGVLKSLNSKTGLNVIDLNSFSEARYNPALLNIIDTSKESYRHVKSGKINPRYAKDTESFISTAVDLSLRNKIAGFVTAPINKEMMIEGGARFGGHTELLGHLLNSENYAMLFYSKKIITVLATIHVPLRNVPGNISKGLIKRIIEISFKSMSIDFGVGKPRIALLGLNPHAGENGNMGSEERDVIIPAMSELKKKGIDVHGPYPSDSFYARRYRDYDLVVSMYHDQALIPFKLLSFDGGANVTIGLEVVRTSPVHGTAYDIAGKNIASTASMLEAIRLSSRISKNRRKHKVWKEK